MVGRVKTYEAIVKGENIPEPGIPESFKVLIKELQSLCLDIKILREEEGEVELKETLDDDVSENLESLIGNGQDDYVEKTLESEIRAGSIVDEEPGEVIDSETDVDS